MKKFVVISIWSSIVLCVINILWLVYNTIQYISIPVWLESEEIYIMLVFIGLLVIFVSHIIINLSIILSLNKQSSSFLSGIILLVIGSISFVSLFFHWGALTDILKEYPEDLEINNEMNAIWISQILHFSYMIYSLIYLIRVKKLHSETKPSTSLIGEQLFVTLNIIGIVCGIIGLLIVLVDFYLIANPQSYKWAIIPYSLFIFMPYILVLFGWFIKAISDKQSGWYDEKQKFDIYKSSTFTLLMSVPIMVALFLFNYDSTNGIYSILWLPFYLFTILFIFSISLLYNFKAS